MQNEQLQPPALETWGSKFERRVKKLASEPEIWRRHALCTTAICDARLNQSSLGEEKIMEISGFSSPAEYWGIALSEPLALERFAGFLTAHSVIPNVYDPDTNTTVNRVKGFIIDALRDAIDMRADIFLDERREHVIPIKAGQWLLNKPKRRHLVPAGLREYLEGNGKNSTPDAVLAPEAISNAPPTVATSSAPIGGTDVDPIRTGLAGRPTSWSLLERECHRRWHTGERHNKTTEWATILLTWLGQEHPNAPLPTKKTVTNNLAPVLRSLKFIVVPEITPEITPEIK